MLTCKVDTGSGSDQAGMLTDDGLLMTVEHNNKAKAKPGNMFSRQQACFQPRCWPILATSSALGAGTVTYTIDTSASACVVIALANLAVLPALEQLLDAFYVVYTTESDLVTQFPLSYRIAEESIRTMDGYRAKVSA